MIELTRVTTGFVILDLQGIPNPLRAIYTFCKFRLIYHGNNPWYLAMEKLKTWNPQYSSFVREVKIHLVLGYKEDPHFFIEDLPDQLQLASTLQKISQTSFYLKKISLVIEEERAHLFQESFSKFHLVFLAVKNVIVGPYNNYIVAYCPNTENLAGQEIRIHSRKARMMYRTPNEHTYRLIHQACSLKNLKCFVLRDRYTAKLMEDLHKSIPHIHTLILEFGLHGAFSFQDFVSNISRFHHLKVLGLAGPSQLHVGFNLPHCGNAYFGPRGLESKLKVYAKIDNENFGLHTPINLQEHWIYELGKLR
ncbi:hypothetical protein BT96DRAFT_938600 [Gymnopus androsaceus JB14]|uniref:Uncharacterized protein n=1 Tax=Gymnopus androsaceus JB14 TaxID=1447944 RepID=A0A6A4HTI2_9AGAR|nr:hypothetical protein BT96DRAFT_938600 [Gymnopus androsaceus JB14]